MKQSREPFLRAVHAFLEPGYRKDCMIVVELLSYRRWVENVRKGLLVALLLIAAMVPASIAVGLLVWPETYPKPGCHINWVGVIPLGGYCT